MKQPPKLTKLEQRLLKYPPTPDSWWCVHEQKVEGDVARVLNAGSNRLCWMCGKKRPRDPERPWLIYQQALAKTGRSDELG